MMTTPDNHNLSSRPAQLGALDLGSNSFHLLVAQESNGRLQVIDKHKEMVRLAAGLDENNRLTQEACDRALACMERFGQRLRSLDPSNVRIVGTNTLRRAEAGDFIARAESVLGHKIEIISGREEARLIYMGVCQDLGATDARRLIADIGGGSTELVLGRRFDPEVLESLYMGCVSMTQRHFPDGSITAKAMRRAQNDALVELEPVTSAYLAHGWDSVVGTSGTINAVGSVLANLFDSDVIRREDLESLAGLMVEAEHVDALDFSGLATERKAVFPGGVAILLGIFTALNIDQMGTSGGALREGLIFDLMGRQHHDDVRVHTVSDLQRRYDIDTIQARHVRETTISLLSQVASDWELTRPACKQALTWACDLHEIGMDVSHSGFQKHGAYLLANLDMPGFTRSEQQLLALLVRSHRRKLATDLMPENSPEALRLTVLLRIAAVLHRNRSHEPLPHIAARAEGASLELTFDGDWWQSHPLTELDLINESAYLQAAAFTLNTRTR